MKALEAANAVLGACEDILHTHNLVLHRLRSLVFELARRSLSCTNVGTLTVPAAVTESHSQSCLGIARKCLADMDASCAHAFGAECHVRTLLAEAGRSLCELEEGVLVKEGLVKEEGMLVKEEGCLVKEAVEREERGNFKKKIKNKKKKKKK